MNKPSKTKINLHELAENGVTALNRHIGECCIGKLWLFIVRSIGVT